MKVRFEIDIDYPEVIEGYPNDADEMFREADGKTFLFRNTITKSMHVYSCEEGISDSRKFALLTAYPLPVNTRIIDSDEYEQDPIGQTYSLLADGLQTLRTEIKESCTEILNTIDQIDKRDTVLTQGIHEDTLLEALRILSKSREN